MQSFTRAFTSVCVCVRACVHVCEFVFGNKRSPPSMLLKEICSMLSKSERNSALASRSFSDTTHQCCQTESMQLRFYHLQASDQRCFCSHVCSFTTPRAFRLDVSAGWMSGGKEGFFSPLGPEKQNRVFGRHEVSHSTRNIPHPHWSFWYVASCCWAEVETHRVV